MNQTLLNRISVVLCAIGLFVAGVLSLSHLLDREVPCGISSSCEKVTNDPSSFWFGIPIAYYGFIGYVLILAFTVLRMMGPSAKVAQFAKFGFALSITGAIVSIGLQIYSIGFLVAFCPWCFGSALTMLALALVHAFIVQRLSGEPVAVEDVAAKPRLDLGLIALLVIGSGVGIGIQAANFGGAKERQTVKKDIFADKSPKEVLIEGGHSMGEANAPVVVVEFADFYCGACRVSFNKMERLVQGSNGKLRWIYRHFPLYMKEGHEMAIPAALLAEQAAREGKFWTIARTIMTAGTEQFKTPEELVELAVNNGMSRPAATKVLRDSAGMEFDRVYADIELANKLGLELTPSFIVFIGDQEPVMVNAQGLDDLMKSSEVQALIGK